MSRMSSSWNMLYDSIKKPDQTRSAVLVEFTYTKSYVAPLCSRKWFRKNDAKTLRLDESKLLFVVW
jgi:hypothetical protein